MKRLWAARMEFDVVVMAETEDDARELVQDHARDEIQNVMLDWMDVDEVLHVRDVEAHWRDSIPYGSEDDRTVAVILSEQHGPAAADDNTMEMFPPAAASPSVGRAH